MANIPTRPGQQVSARPYSMPEAQKISDARGGGGHLIGQGFMDLGVGLQKLGGGIGHVEQLADENAQKEQEKADRARANDATSEAIDNITTRTVGDAKHEAARQAAEAAFSEPDPEPVQRGDYKDQPLTEEQLLGAGGGTASSAEGAPATGAAAEAPAKAMPTEVQVGEAVAELRARREQPGGVRGFLGTKGLSASQLSAEAIGSVTQDRARIRKGLANDRQREIFDQQTLHLYAEARIRMEEHVARENTATIAATDLALKQSALTAVFADPENEDGARAQSAVVEQSIRSQNLPAPVMKAQLEAWQSKVATARITSLLDDKNFKGAEKVLDGAKGTLDPVVAKDLKKQVAVVRLGEEATTYADAAVEFAREPSGKVDLEKVDQMISRLPGGPLREAANKRADELKRESVAQWGQTVDNHYNSAFTTYLKTGRLSAVDPREKLWLEDNAPAKWHQLLTMQKADAEHARGAPPTADQQRAMTQFEVDLHDNRSDFAVMSEAEFNSKYASRLAKSDREKAGLMFAGAHSDAAKQGTLTTAEKGILIETGRAAGVFPPKQNDVSKWPDDQAQVHYKASQQLTDWATSYRRTYGKAPSEKEMQQKVDDLFLQGKDPEGGFLGIGGGTTRIEAETKGTGFAPKWTDKQKIEATTALKKIGAKATDAAVESYLRRKHGLPALPIQATPTEEPTTETPDIPQTSAEQTGTGHRGSY